MDGLFEMLSINNGPNFTGAISSPIRSHHFNRRLASIRSTYVNNLWYCFYMKFLTHKCPWPNGLFSSKKKKINKYFFTCYLFLCWYLCSDYSPGAGFDFGRLFGILRQRYCYLPHLNLRWRAPNLENGYWRSPTSNVSLSVDYHHRNCLSRWPSSAPAFEIRRTFAWWALYSRR